MNTDPDDMQTHLRVISAMEQIKDITLMVPIHAFGSFPPSPSEWEQLGERLPAYVGACRNANRAERAARERSNVSGEGKPKHE